MSRGFEDSGLNWKVLDCKDFTNVFQFAVGEGDTTVGASAQAFNYLTNQLINPP